MTGTNLNILLIILMLIAIGGGIIAISVRTLISSVVSLGTVGMILSIIFLLLRAPDIAITQVVVEILTLVVLVRVTLGRDVSADMTSSKPYILPLVIIFGLFSAVFITYHALMLPAFGYSPMAVGTEYLAVAPEKLKTANVVTSVILDFRGYDTIGEATVIFTGIIGAIVLLRKKGKEK
jgi:multicomponent Na+:H+ antiporter subunit B